MGNLSFGFFADTYSKGNVLNFSTNATKICKFVLRVVSAHAGALFLMLAVICCNCKSM